MIFTKPKPSIIPDDQARIDDYLDACRSLADAICEHAPDYLQYRAQVIARVTGRDLPASAPDVLNAEGCALSAALRDALAGVDWIPLRRYLRSHGFPDVDAPPEQLAPLSAIVEGHLVPLRTAHGFPLRPTAAQWGRIAHSPLSQESWPGFQRKRVERPTAIAAFGMTEHFPDAPLTEWHEASVPHPIHQHFRNVSRAAARLEVVDLGARR